MNVVVTTRDRLGRLHPVEPVPPDEARLVRVLVHRYRCIDGYSIRQTQAMLLEEHGLRRSTGRIHQVLCRFACAWCQSDD